MAEKGLTTIQLVTDIFLNIIIAFVLMACAEKVCTYLDHLIYEQDNGSARCEQVELNKAARKN